MVETKPPFVDNGSGFPEPDSVKQALNMYNLDKLANLTVSYRGQEGSMVDLIARCRIEHLTQDWPRGFIAQVIGAAAEAARQANASSY